MSGLIRWAIGFTAACTLVVGCGQAEPEVKTSKDKKGEAAKPCKMEAGKEAAKPSEKKPAEMETATPAKAVQPKPAAAPMPEPTEAEKGKPFAVVAMMSKPVVLDGQIEAAWGEPIPGPFVDTLDGKPVDWQTKVWLLYDKTNFYIAARMAEPDMSELVCLVEDRDGDVWQDDAMEIFIDPTNTLKEDLYYHIMVNAAGVVADRQGAPDSMGADWAWDAEGIKAKAFKGKDYWSFEMAVPLAAMEVKEVAPGQRWAVNFCRTRHGNLMESAWANTGPETFHRPETFGHVVLR
jgi:hypothetical protein